MDFLDGPAAIQGCTLILSCTTNNASSNEHMHPDILMKNHHKNTYSFAWYLPAIIPDHDISSCACIVLLSEASSSSHVEFNIARQRRPLASETSILPCLTASKHEICHIDIMHDTLVHPNLSHMDFLDDPAAIHTCTLILSCATNNASSKELSNP